MGVLSLREKYLGMEYEEFARRMLSLGRIFVSRFVIAPPHPSLPPAYGVFWADPNFVYKCLVRDNKVADIIPDAFFNTTSLSPEPILASYYNSTSAAQFVTLAKILQAFARYEGEDGDQPSAGEQGTELARAGAENDLGDRGGASPAPAEKPSPPGERLT